MTDDRETHISTEEVRAGSTPGVTRPVLIVSLVLIVLIMAGLLIACR